LRYRRTAISAEVDKTLRDVCWELATWYAISFLEIRPSREHVHFLMQNIPPHSATKLARVVQGLTTWEIFRRAPALKKYR
jgi:REP element-mobilizing transposase RayT